MTASIADSRRRIRRAATAAALMSLIPAWLSAQKGDGKVLQGMIEGTAAFWQDDKARAEFLFEAVAASIDGVWGGTTESAKARELWYAESVKPFRGEAYERMMAFYYRGLLYLRAKDFGNAQAAFRKSVQQDAFAEEDQYQSDVCAPLLLLGLSLQAQGSTAGANSAFASLRKLRPMLPSVDAYAAIPSALLIVETGTAPRKVSDGLNAEQLKVFRGKGFAERAVRVSVDSGPLTPVWPMEDVYYQASTRGGRPIDYLLGGKAHFATRTSNSGFAFADLGSNLSQYFTYQQSVIISSGGGRSLTLTTARSAADGLEAVGATISLLGALVKPAADVRYWNNLPDAIHILPLALPPGRHHLVLRFYSADGSEIGNLAQERSILIGGDASGPDLILATSRPRVSDLSQLPRRSH